MNIYTSFYESICIHLYIYIVFQILGGVSLNFGHDICFVWNMGIREEHDSSCMFRCENESFWWTWEFVGITHRVREEYVLKLYIHRVLDIDITYLYFVENVCSYSMHMYESSWRYVYGDGYESLWCFSHSTWWIRALIARTFLWLQRLGLCRRRWRVSWSIALCCIVLQGVAGCCRALQCGAVGCCVWQFFQCVAACCRALQCVALRCGYMGGSEGSHPVCCSVVQRVQVCCSAILFYADDFYGGVTVLIVKLQIYK